MEWDTLGLPRLNGFSYEPAYFALYLVPGTLVALSQAGRLGRRGLGAGGLAVMFLAALALSTSRSGWLGIAVGIGLLLTLLVLRAGMAAAARLGGVAVAGAVACGLVLAASPTLRTHLARFAKMGVDRGERTSSAPRLEAMREAATYFADHPVLGVGLAGYGAHVLRHPLVPRQADRGPFGIVTANLYLELASETGLLGLAAALALLGTLLLPLSRRLWKAPPHEPTPLAAARDGLLAASLVVILVMFQFNQTLWRLDVWILLALSFAAGTLPPRRSEG